MVARGATRGLVLVVVIGACALLLHVPRAWAFDGYTYAIMAQTDAGIPYARARADAQRIVRSYPYERTPARRAKLASWYPPYWRLFKARPFYPMMAALLWPRFGVASMFIVSAVAFVALMLLTYLLVLRYTYPFVAALATFAVGLSPIVAVLAARPLTDELALALWMGFILAALRYADRPTAWRLLAAGALAMALNLTRPVVYAPVCCVAPLVFMRSREGVRLLIVTLLAAVPTGVIAAIAHASVPLPSPYFAAAVDAAKTVVKELLVTVLPALGIVGLLLIRRRADRAILLGAVAAVLPAIFANPFGVDMVRVAVAPVLPLAACGGGAIVMRALDRLGTVLRRAQDSTSLR